MPCNSIASEYAFSTQNLIHTRSHNQLKSATTNKLIYIYTNTQILHQFYESTLFSQSIKVMSINNLTVEEEVQLENVLLGIDVDDNGIIMDVMDAGNWRY